MRCEVADGICRTADQSLLENGFTHANATLLTVLLCAGIYDAGAGVGESGQLDSVLLAQQSLVMAAFFDIVDLYCLVALGCHAQLAGIIVVN